MRALVVPWLVLACAALARADEVERLVARLGDPDSTTRADAAIALRARGGDEVRSALERRVRAVAPAPDERRAARIDALAGQLLARPESMHEAAALQLAQEGRAAIGALEARLRDVPAGERPRARALLELLSRTPDEARVEAALLLAELGTAESAPALHDALASRDEQVAVAAAFALRAITGDGPRADPLAWCEPADGERARWREALAHGLPDPLPARVAATVAIVTSAWPPIGTTNASLDLEVESRDALRAFLDGGGDGRGGSSFTWRYGKPLPGRFQVVALERERVLVAAPGVATLAGWLAAIAGDERLEVHDASARVLDLGPRAGRARRFVSVVLRLRRVRPDATFASTLALQGLATLDAEGARDVALELAGFARSEL